MCLPAKTWVTGLAPGVSKTGMVVDPLNLTGSFGPKNSAPTPPDPAIERASAEAEAAQRANMQLANNNRRRREQQSLMSKGAPTAPQFAFGDATTDPGSDTLSTMGATTRSTTATRASLMSRGAAPVATGGGATYGGVGRIQQASMR